MNRFWLAGLLVLAAWSAQAKPPAAAPGAVQPAFPACAAGPRWIVSAGSLRRSQAKFPLAEQREYLDSACTFLLEPAHGVSGYGDWRAVHTASATSLKQVARDVRDPAAVIILYDPEAWKYTPIGEQRDPVAAACSAAAAAHRHGKRLIVAPAVDLVRVLAPDAAGPGQRYATFERLKLASGMARCADVYEVQAQGAEADAAKFRHFVQVEAHQARAANPRILVLAGLSTNPSGHRVSARQVYTAVESVRDSVDGYWLNIPAGGGACPRCGAPQPQVAAELLRLMGHGGASAAQ